MRKKIKKRYSAKQKRMAEHIEKTYEKKGFSRARAWSVAWATVRKFLGEGPDSKRICRIIF